MKKYLNAFWTLSFTTLEGKHYEIPAQVPGNVIGDMFRANIIPDPYFGCNSNMLRPYEFIDWMYSTKFHAPILKKDERLQINLDGVDTIFELRINGKSVGNGKNMFIPHHFDITDHIRQDSENELSVKIESSIQYARKFKRPNNVSGSPYGYEGVYIRSPKHSYGWDIAPRLIGAGIWRSVSIEIIEPTRWTDVYLYTVSFDKHSAHMALDWSFDTDSISLDGFSALICLTCGEQKFEYPFTPTFVTGKTHFDLPDPQLWEPAGYGKQHLYQVELHLYQNGKKVAVKNFRTGIRTVRLEHSELGDSESSGKFQFHVNEKPVFIKGSNWVPFEALHGEHPERMRKSLELFAEAGCNMVRCWGGNVYEDDDFFDYCDELGLIVWQDFMFACEFAPLDPDFLEQVREEAECIVKKLRQHPALVLWSGDNECDEKIFWDKEYNRRKPSENKITRVILPQAVASFDPVRDFLPSSPYIADSAEISNNHYGIPEQHLWGPRDNFKSCFYKENKAVFASEIGYHGMPCLDSVRKFIPDGELNGRTTSPAWNCHASQPFNQMNGPWSYRIQLMIDQVCSQFGTCPDDLEKFIELSQSVQAEAFKFFIELFRMNKPKKTGLIWWNVIDCWPQFSDAVVDYYYRKKLAFRFIRKSQQDVCLMFSEPDAWCITLKAVNDRREPVALSYKVTDIDDGKEYLSGSADLPADGVTDLDSLRICQGEQKMYLIEWNIQGRTFTNHYTQGVTPLDPDRYLNWLKKIIPSSGRDNR